MDAKDVAAILTSIAWPVTAATLVLAFHRPIVRLSESLAVKTIKLKVLGAEIELTAEQAKNALDELLKDILESTTGLPPTEIDLFQKIQDASGRQRVLQLLPKFVRGNDEHLRLRVLRDRKLIRPFEGGQWDALKHPVVTHFGELILRIKPEVLAKPRSNS